MIYPGPIFTLVSVHLSQINLRRTVAFVCSRSGGLNTWILIGLRYCTQLNCWVTNEVMAIDSSLLNPHWSGRRDSELYLVVMTLWIHSDKLVSSSVLLLDFVQIHYWLSTISIRSDRNFEESNPVSAGEVGSNRAPNAYERSRYGTRLFVTAGPQIILLVICPETPPPGNILFLRPFTLLSSGSPSVMPFHTIRTM